MKELEYPFITSLLPKIEAYEQMFKQREKALSVLDRIWANVPPVSEEEAPADIERAIVEVRAKKAGKPVSVCRNAHGTGYESAH